MVDGKGDNSERCLKWGDMGGRLLRSFSNKHFNHQLIQNSGRSAKMMILHHQPNENEARK